MDAQATIEGHMAGFPKLSYGGAHLRTFPPGTIAAGLGGIDPKM